MGWRITDHNNKAFYDSVTGWAFGPITTKKQLIAFAKWLTTDPRAFSNSELENLYNDFLEGKDYSIHLPKNSLYE